MAANIGEIRLGVSARIKDGAAALSTSPDVTCDVDRAILAALAEYQQARPRERVTLVTGTAAFDYLTSLLTGFSDGFSNVVEIVYPWDATTPTPTVLADDRYAIVRLSTGLYLRFFDVVPAVTQQFQARYTTPHTLDASSSTVAVGDDQALMDLGAAYACDMLAGKYSQETESSISADTFNRLAKAREYRDLAAEWRKAYESKLGGAEADQPAAAVGAVLGTFQTRTDRYFFHGRQN